MLKNKKVSSVEANIDDVNGAIYHFFFLNISKICTSSNWAEIKAIPDLKNAIQHCEKVSDFVTRNIFREILDSEEEHYDWLETQIQLSDQLGKENWLQSQL